MQQFKQEQSLGELFSALLQDVRTLIQQEIRLAKIEMSETASELGKAVAFMAAGGLIAYAGFLVLLGAAVLALATALPAWLSALIVGVIVLIAAFVLFQKGRSGLKPQNLTPRQTIETIQEHKEWVQDEMRGNGNGKAH